MIDKACIRYLGLSYEVLRGQFIASTSSKSSKSPSRVWGEAVIINVSISESSIPSRGDRGDSSSQGWAVEMCGTPFSESRKKESSVAMAGHGFSSEKRGRRSNPWLG